MEKALKRIAYIITGVINPWGMGSRDDIDAIPLWVAVAVCLIGILLLPLTIIAIIIFLLQKLA